MSVVQAPTEQEDNGSFLCGKNVAIDENGQGLNFKLLSLQRPHMRAFHLSWFGFFVAFTSWFAFAPLMPSVRKDIALTKLQINSANMASVASTIFFRVIVGPLCDKFGARRVFAIMLCFGGIPACMGGLVNSATSLMLMRAWIGTIGCVFVPCQMWTTYMFAPKVVGSANAMVGGWGNLGGGFTYLIMPQLFSMFYAFGLTESMAWRVSFTVPGAVCLCVAYLIWNKSDDSPETFGLGAGASSSVNDGTQFTDVEPATEPKEPKASNGAGFGTVLMNPTVWMLVFIYGMCFGVELAVNNKIGLYFFDNFRRADCDPLMVEDECRVLTQSTSGLIASLFGLMNLFARACGGFASDYMNTRHGIPGRQLVLMGTLGFEAIFLYVFQAQTTIPTALLFLVCFSTCVQMSEGATYGVVPYVDRRFTGTIAGLVGAGGNAGAVACGFVFRGSLNDTPAAFRTISMMIASACVVTAFTFVNGSNVTHMLTKSKSSIEAAEFKTEMMGFKGSMEKRVAMLEAGNNSLAIGNEKEVELHV